MLKKGILAILLKNIISENDYKERLSRGISTFGDILFTTEAPLGNVAIADLEVFSSGQRLITLQKLYGNDLNNKFVMYYMLSKIFQNILENNKTGSTVSGIKAEKLKERMIILPPAKEQQKIVEKIEEIFLQLDNILSNLQ